MAELDRSCTSGSINLFLPTSNSTDQNKALAHRIVAALQSDPVTGPAIVQARGGAGGARPAPGIVVLQDDATASASECVPSLNPFIGVLTVPMTPGIPLDAVTSAIREVPGADGVSAEAVKQFGIPRGESPR